MTRLSEVTRLELSHNPMTYLGEESVSMAKLTHLFLDHMSLQDMSHSAVSKCPSLVHLDLSHNQLRVLQPLSPGTPSLARVSLAGNPIYCNCYLRSLREWAVGRKVRLLGSCGGPAHLSGEPLDSMTPSELRCQSHDAMLKAEYEEATRNTPPPTPPTDTHIKCPDNCVCQAETQHSTCENRGLSKIPRGFDPGSRLLDLRGNNFHYVPSGSFPGVSQAVSLHLQRCHIVDVEDGAFSGMRGLVYLYLSQNQLSSLSPDAFKGLPQLTYLHLEQNRFSLVPAGAFRLLPGLLALHLENNSISALGAGALSGADSLRSLYLSGNSIQHVAPGALEPTPDLDTLHLGANQLKEVPTDALSAVGGLRELRLTGNPILWVGPQAFRPVQRTLKELYLNNMGLERMSPDSLSGLAPGLRSLFLEGNLLEEVPDFRSFRSLEVINLAENPLMCDCPLLALRMWIEKVNLRVRATCANPPEVRGRWVKDVHTFHSCPGGESLPPAPPTTTQSPRPPKATKPKPTHLNRKRQAKMPPTKTRTKTKTRTGPRDVKKAV